MSLSLSFTPYQVTSNLFLICRLQLAVLHFNENGNRKQAVTKKGEERYIIYPKYKKGGYIVRKVVQNPTYGRFLMYVE